MVEKSSQKQANSRKRKRNISLVLSILLSVSLAQALSVFLHLTDKTTWILFSALFVSIIIVIIYWINGVQINDFKDRKTGLVEVLKVISIGMIVLLPYFFQKLDPSVGGVSERCHWKYTRLME